MLPFKILHSSSPILSTYQCPPQFVRVPKFATNKVALFATRGERVSQFSSVIHSLSLTSLTSTLFSK